MGCHCLPQPSYRQVHGITYASQTALSSGNYTPRRPTLPHACNSPYSLTLCIPDPLFTCAEGLGTRLPTTSHLLEWTENHTTNYTYNVHIQCVPTRISKQKGTALSAAAIACSSYGNINFESILVKFLLYSIHRPFGTVMITLQKYPQGCIVNISHYQRENPCMHTNATVHTCTLSCS